MEAKRFDGLTVKQARFAALLAQGHTQSDTYREAYETDSAKPETVWQEASRLAPVSGLRRDRRGVPGPTGPGAPGDGARAASGGAGHAGV